MPKLQAFEKPAYSTKLDRTTIRERRTRKSLAFSEINSRNNEDYIDYKSQNEILASRKY
jgi:hypothetical protein